MRAYDVTVSNNYAGGVFAGADNCNLEIYNSEIVHNNACDLGALLVRGWGLASNCDISYNTLSIGRGTVNFYRTASVGPGAGTVTHSRVVGNVLVGDGVQDAYGAGVRVSVNSYGVLVDNCEIRDNIVTNSLRAYGGGVYMSSNVVLRNSLVCGNWAYGVHGDADKGGVGAGIYIESGAANRVESCTVVGNHAKLGGSGIYLKGSGADTILNTVVASNQVGGAGLYDDWHFEVPDRRTNVFYTCTPEADGAWGAGCIGADPLFAGPDSGNYRLQTGSPGINAGTNQAWMPGAYDLAGRPRLDRFTRLVDMGCYEFVPPGTMYIVK